MAQLSRMAVFATLAAAMHGAKPAICAEMPAGAAHDLNQGVSFDLVDRWADLIGQAADRFGIPSAWIRAVMRAESAGRLDLGGRPITSPAGAMGLMQLMPETYAALGRRYGLGGDAFDTHDNIMAGTAYLRELYDRYGYPDLFAAYNAGPGRFEAHLRDRRPLPAETEAYLAVVQTGGRGRPQGVTGFPDALFFMLGSAGASTRAGVDGGLFVPLS